VRVEPGGGEAGEAGLGERRAIELEERRGNGVEAEGIAFLQDNASKLAPDFDDEGFVMDSLLDHGADLPCPDRHGHDPTNGQWWRLPNSSGTRANNDGAASIWRLEFFRAGALPHMTKE
jgi:hypothetical protein